MRKPWERLPMIRHYWLADIVWRLDGFLGRRDVARVSWVADLAGARSWAQGNGSFAFGMLTHARPCAIH